jgi:hypothetical protein
MGLPQVKSVYRQAEDFGTTSDIIRESGLIRKVMLAKMFEHIKKHLLECIQNGGIHLRDIFF